VAYHFDFEPAHRLLRGRFEGSVDDEELAAFCKDAGEKIALSDPLCELTDFTDVVRFKATPEQIRWLARTGHTLPDPTRPRVIVAPDDLVFGTARMYELEGEGTRPHVYVVRTLKEALAIFGITEELHFQPVPAAQIEPQTAKPC
jgi:hypothetical protein